MEGHGHLLPLLRLPLSRPRPGAAEPPHLHGPQGTPGELLEEVGASVRGKPAAMACVPGNVWLVALCSPAELDILWCDQGDTHDPYLMV